MQIHAEYNRTDDEYLPHRISQAFEMSQFIRLTSTECDVVVAAGDFNLESSDVGYKLLLTNTPLYDAWENKVWLWSLGDATQYDFVVPVGKFDISWHNRTETSHMLKVI